MPDPLSSEIIEEKNTLLSGEFWPWLIQIQLDDSSAIRITTHDSEIEYGGYTWQPFTCKLETVDRDGDGTLTGVQLVVSNLGGEVAGYLRESNNNIMGRKAKIYIVCTAEDPITTKISPIEFIVMNAAMVFSAATFTLGRPDFSGTVTPTRRYLRTRCGHNKFGDNGCGFRLDREYDTIPDDYPDVSCETCDYGLFTKNGCVAHGRLEEVNGYDKDHPNRFGGQPGIPYGKTRL